MMCCNHTGYISIHYWQAIKRRTFSAFLNVTWKQLDFCNHKHWQVYSAYMDQMMSLFILAWWCCTSSPVRSKLTEKQREFSILPKYWSLTNLPIKGNCSSFCFLFYWVTAQNNSNWCWQLFLFHSVCLSDMKQILFSFILRWSLMGGAAGHESHDS